MIEVEKKFQPTEEQLKALLNGSKFVAKKENNDIYYDYPDFRLLKESIKLRNRNGSFELKIRMPNSSHSEVEDKKEIEKFFNLENGLEEFVKNNLEIVGSFKTFRDEYEKDGFVIDIDVTDFGYEMCEIEILVETEEQTEEAKNRILNFAHSYNLESKKLKPKLTEYLKKNKPEVYKEIYKEKKELIKFK
jgi:adenylate cyclase class IV